MPTASSGSPCPTSRARRSGGSSNAKVSFPCPTRSGRARGGRRSIDTVSQQSLPFALLGSALAKTDQRAEAEGLLRKLLDRQRRGYLTPTSLAVLYAGLGDTTETFAWLQKAVEGHDPFLIYNYVTDPIMAPFRQDPRGQAILRAMRLATR
jgi:hypothetical protein